MISTINCNVILVISQLSPNNWELAEKVISVLKPFYITTKSAESDSVSISEVIPLIKKLTYDIGAVEHSGIGTLKSELLRFMKRLVYIGQINFDKIQENLVQCLSLRPPKKKSSLALIPF